MPSCSGALCTAFSYRNVATLKKSLLEEGAWVHLNVTLTGVQYWQPDRNPILPQSEQLLKLWLHFFTIHSGPNIRNS
jgi:hypothetical protein